MNIHGINTEKYSVNDQASAEKQAGEVTTIGKNISRKIDLCNLLPAGELSDQDMKEVKQNCSDRDVAYACFHMNRRIERLNDEIKILKGNCAKISEIVPYAVVKESDISGKGVFANKAFKKNETIGEYRGRRVFSFPCEKKPGHFFVFEVDSKKLIERGVSNISSCIEYRENDTHVLWLNTKVGNTAIEAGVDGRNCLKYINHSKKPNTKIDVNCNEKSVPWGKVNDLTATVKAVENIVENEELFFHYDKKKRGRIYFDECLIENINNHKEIKVEIEKAVSEVILIGKPKKGWRRGGKRTVNQLGSSRVETLKAKKVKKDEGGRNDELYESNAVVDIEKLQQAVIKEAEAFGVTEKIINSCKKEDFDTDMSDEKWEEYGDFWNYLNKSRGRKVGGLAEDKKDVLNNLIADINNEELDKCYRLKLFFVTEFYWLESGLERDWKKSEEIAVDKNYKIANEAGVTQKMIQATTCSSFHAGEEFTTDTWYKYAEFWDRLDRMQSEDELNLTTDDKKILMQLKRDIYEAPTDQCSQVLKNKLLHTTNVFWSKAGFAVNWQILTPDQNTTRQ